MIHNKKNIKKAKDVIIMGNKEENKNKEERQDVIHEAVNEEQKISPDPTETEETNSAEEMNSSQETDSTEDTSSTINEEINKIKAELEEKNKKCQEYFKALQRSVAEFDNYRKRVLREREALRDDIIGDTVAEFLPVLDNLERAINSCDNNTDVNSLLEGVKMVFKQFKDILTKLGVEEIQAVGETFNPELHNAVMHVEDEEAGENVIIEEFQKGYKLKEKVIRHSMVKVAN